MPGKAVKRSCSLIGRQFILMSLLVIVGSSGWPHRCMNSIRTCKRMSAPVRFSFHLCGAAQRRQERGNMRKYLDRLTFIAVLLLAASTALAKDGAAIYKSKCAACHGTQGEGKAGPKLAGTSLSEDDIVNVL